MIKPLINLLRCYWGILMAVFIFGERCLAADSSTATATAFPFNGFIVAVVINTPGSGYTVAPEVTIAGGGGSGARATATISMGGVTGIAVVDAGSGYTSAPTVTISPPEPPGVIDIQFVPRLTLRGAAGLNYEIQYAEILGHQTNWIGITNFTFPLKSEFFVDTTAPAAARRFYRLKLSDPPPNPNPAQFAWIPPGTFSLGSPATEADRQPNEGPQTEVTISQGFWMARYEVNQAEYLALIGSNPSGLKGSSLPVESVTWFNAMNYCARLTEREAMAGRLPAGYVYRLPTEAEWEWASRAGTKTRFSFGDDPGYPLLSAYGWSQSNSGNSIRPVGVKMPNSWGLYDMNGNVFEWCLDWFGNYPGGRATDYSGPAFGVYRVLRGGSAYNLSNYCRSASRGYREPGFTQYDDGFRVVLGRPIP